MASGSSKRSRTNVDYKQLHSFSSTVLYDTTPRRSRSKFFDVERIIERRKKPQGYEYLIKWKGWPFHSCSWEPSENLTPVLLRSYDQPPKPAEPRLERACRDFLQAIQTSLKSKSMASSYVNIELDVWRYITHRRGEEAEHKGHKLYSKDDFARFSGLPADWFYVLNQHGEGMAIRFPIKAKAVVSWTPSRFVSNNGTLELASRIPLEKITIDFAKRACNIGNI